MPRKKVWAVAHGSYSDYTVDHLFTKKKLAEEYCETRNRGKVDDGWGSNYSVEKFWLWDEQIPRYENLHASISVDGEIQFGIGDLLDGPPDNTQRVGAYGVATLNGEAEWVRKVAGEISAARKAWKAGIADPPPGWPPEPPPKPEPWRPGPTMGTSLVEVAQALDFFHRAQLAVPEPSDDTLPQENADTSPQTEGL